RVYDCTETVARIAANPANETLRNTSRGPICPRNAASSVRYFAYAGRRMASEAGNGEFEMRPNEFPVWTKIPLSGKRHYLAEGGRHGRARISREGGGDLYGAFASSRRPERICPLSRVPRPPTYFGLRPGGRAGGRHPVADRVVRGVHVRPRARIRDVHALRVQRDLRNRHDGLRRRGRHAGAVPRFDRDRWLSSRTVC